LSLLKELRAWSSALVVRRTNPHCCRVGRSVREREAQNHWDWKCDDMATVSVSCRALYWSYLAAVLAGRVELLLLAGKGPQVAGRNRH
jgi:hypothetical protein